MSTTTIIQADVAGSSYIHSDNDYSKLRAVRKFIVRSNATHTGAETSGGLVYDMKANTGATDESTTLLGPRYIDPDDDDADNTTNAITHPSNNELFLQTVECTKMGNERWLVTANYFIIASSGGGGAQASRVIQLRTEFYAKRYYRQWDKGTLKNLFDPMATNITQFAQTVILPQMKIQIPFATTVNPVSNTTVMLTGAPNSGTIEFTSTLVFAENSLRFDGVQMDEYGSMINSGGTSARYVGVAEYTARDWQEEVPLLPSGGPPWSINATATPGLRSGAAFVNIDGNGMPIV